MRRSLLSLWNNIWNKIRVDIRLYSYDSILPVVLIYNNIISANIISSIVIIPITTHHLELFSTYTIYIIIRAPSLSIMGSYKIAVRKVINVLWCLRTENTLFLKKRYSGDSRPLSLYIGQYISCASTFQFTGYQILALSFRLDNAMFVAWIKAILIPPNTLFSTKTIQCIANQSLSISWRKKCWLKYKKTL